MSKRFFSESEIQELIETSEFDRVEYEDRRWSRLIKSIVKVDDKYYEVYWDQGLTEMQEDYYEAGECHEVYRQSSLRCELVDEWVKKVENNDDDKEKHSREIMQSLEVLGADKKFKKSLEEITEKEINTLIILLDKMGSVASISDKIDARHKAAVDLIDYMMILKDM